MQKISNKEQRIKKELNRIKKIFKNLDEDKKKISESLMKNAAFMAITLEDLQAEINEKGCTEEYQNGQNQHGIKESTASKVYNSMIKNYTSCIKQLIDLLPKTDNAATDTVEDAAFAKLLNM